MESETSSGLRRMQDSETCGHRREPETAIANSQKPHQNQVVQQDRNIVDNMCEKWTSLLCDVKQASFPSSLKRDAKTTLAFAEGLLNRNEQNKSHNRRMDFRKTSFVLIGMLCLVVPTLLLFDLLLSVFYYAELVEVLNYASRESSPVGSVASACVNVLKIASFLRGKNESYNGAVAWSFLGAMLSLLCLIRYTTSLKPVMCHEAREKVVRLRNLIQDALDEDSDNSVQKKSC